MRPNRILQLLLDNRAATRRVEMIRNDATNEATLYLYDAIVSDTMMEEWGYGVSAQTLVPQIREIAGGTLHLRINSPGGDVFAGQAIAQAVRDCKAHVIVHVDGVAASAASVVAIAAAEIEIAEGGFFMVHQSSTMCWGCESDLLETAALLAKVDDSIASQYARRTGGDKAAMLKLMVAETWLNAEDAVAQGFANRVATGTAAEARWNLSAYADGPAPIGLKALHTSAGAKPPAPAASGDKVITLSKADLDRAITEGVAAGVANHFQATAEADAFTASLRRRAQLAATRT